MIVLAFDTATPSTAVAVSLPDGGLLEARDDPAAGERPGHATRLLPLAEQVLASAGLGWREIERFAVGIGPGTFTGLRVGIATAHGVAQSRGVPLVGISSLRALARGVGEHERPVLAAIDARRGEMFVAGYQADVQVLSPAAVSPAALACALAPLSCPSSSFASASVPSACAPTASGPSACAPLASVPSASVPSACPPLASVPSASGHSRAWRAVGDGAVLYREACEAVGAEVPPDGDPVHRIRATALCELAASAPEPEGDALVLPAYLRRPDAKPALQGVAS